MNASKLKPGIAILASGSGSTAEAFIHATQDGRVDAYVGLVVCSQPPEKAGIHQRVARLNRQYGLNIRTIVINGQTHPDGNEGRGQTTSESAAICELIKRKKLDLVALMGYMRIIRGALIDEYGWKPGMESVFEARMINTHPGPLPETEDTYGLHASQRVLELGMPASRHTVHVVAAGVDKGPVLAEHPVEVKGDDTPGTLFDRVQTVEKAALPYAIDKFLREQQSYLG
jgi:phosphoribosylglycinamide formyltransferase-1